MTTPDQKLGLPYPPNLNRSHIYRELRRLAFLGEDFRNRHTGTFSLVFEQGDPVNLADYTRADWTPDREWPLPRIVEGYRFEAQRTEVDATKNVYEFNYSYTNGLHGIKMPRHIAEYAFSDPDDDDSDPHDPVVVAGPSAIERTIDIDISSSDMELTVKETVSYYDSDGNRASHTASVLEPFQEEVLTVVPSLAILDRLQKKHSDEGSIVNQEPHSPIEFSDLTDPNAPTSFYSDAADFMERQPGAETLDDMRDIILDFDSDTQDLVLAYHVLQSMKNTFRRQLGMAIPKT